MNSLGGRLFFVFLGLLSSLVSSSSEAVGFIQSPVTIGDFPFAADPDLPQKRRFSYDRSSMNQLFDEFYYNDRVLANRAEPTNSLGHSYIPVRSEIIIIENQILERFISALESFIQQGLIQHLFFPDAGHAHVLLPTNGSLDADSTISPQSLEKALNSGNFALLLHVNEQFDFQSIRHHECSYESVISSRNLFYRPSVTKEQADHFAMLSTQHQPTDGYRGIKTVEGYTTTSSSLYFHSNQHGHFEYFHAGRDRVLKLDFSMQFH